MLGPASGDRFGHLVSGLLSTDVTHKKITAIELGRMDESVAGAVVDAAFSSCAKTDRAHLALFLGINKCRPAARAIAGRLFSDNSAAVRIACACSLGYMHDVELQGHLVQALHDPNERVVIAVCVALLHIGAVGASSALLQTLNEGAWKVRLYKSIVLLGLGSRDPRILTVLRELACQPEAIEHDAGVQFMKSIEADSQDQFPDVIGALRPIADIVEEACSQIEQVD